MWEVAVVLAIVIVVISAIFHVLRTEVLALGNITPKNNGRDLDPIESLMSTMHDIAGNYTLSNALLIRSKVPLTKQIIHQATTRLVRTHPMLNVELDNSDISQMKFTPCAELKVPILVSETEDWKSLMEEQVRELFDYEKEALWRLWFLPNAKYQSLQDEEKEEFSHYPHEGACVFVFHHSIIDGMSYMNLYDQFLTHLHQVINGKEEIVQPMKMLPPLYSYIMPQINFTFFDKILVIVVSFLSRMPCLAWFLMKLLARKNLYIKKHGSLIAQDPSLKRRTRVVPVEFSREETSALLAACRANNTTVQGAIQTAASLSMADILHDGKFASETNISVVVPVNARKLIDGRPVSDRYVGMYFLCLKSIQQVHSVKCKEDFWSMSHKASRNIKDAIAKGRVFDCLKEINIFSIIARNLPFLDLFAEPSRRGDYLLAFSNMGNCRFLDQSNDSAVKLRARFGCTAEHSFGPIFVCNFVTFRGKIFLTVVYYSHVLTKERAKTFTQGIKDNLAMYAK